MTKPTRNWLIDPVFPSAAGVPQLDAETRELAGMTEPGDSATSGTWAVGTRAEEYDDDDVRFAKSDTEAPTVRPGSLHAAKAG